MNEARIPIVSYPGYGRGVGLIEGYKVGNQILTRKDMGKLLVALTGLKSVDGDKQLTSLITKLIPGETAPVMSESDYTIDLSSCFRDSPVAIEQIRL